jgi:glycosyltransferase involved in cell wall biosynthesis
MKISVIIPARNVEKYIADCLESILQQTYPVYEIIIIHDASTDSTLEILKTYKKLYSHLILIENTTQKGIAYCRNIGIKTATGDIIAFADADDIALSMRFEMQVNYLKNNPQIGVLGCWVDFFSDNDVSNIIKYYYPVCEDEAIKAHLLFHNVLVNTSLVIRKNVFDKVKIWHIEDFTLLSDYELFTRLIPVTNMQNIPQVLQKAREHTHRSTNKQSNVPFMKYIFKNNLQKIHLTPTETELQLHYDLTRPSERNDLAYLQEVNVWLTKIYHANAQYKAFPERALNNYLKELWLRHFAGKMYESKAHYKLYQNSILSPYQNYTLWQKTKFWIKGLWL